MHVQQTDSVARSRTDLFLEQVGPPECRAVLCRPIAYDVDNTQRPPAILGPVAQRPVDAPSIFAHRASLAAVGRARRDVRPARRRFKKNERLPMSVSALIPPTCHVRLQHAS